MLDPRIYRAALIPVLFALVLLAFSLEDRPAALGTTLSPDAFQGKRAFAGLEQLAQDFPSRRPGSAGDRGLGDRVADRLRSNGFRTRTISRDGQTIDGERRLDTVIGERTGTADGRVVVVAHRDAAGRGAEAELSGTAGLLELARVFGAPRTTERTLTLVSTSGGSGGAAGAAALADALGGQQVSAVVVLGDLASQRLDPPFVVSWSDDLGQTTARLQRTLEGSVRSETLTGAGLPRAASQLARYALPVTFSEQGALLADDLPAVLLSASGERPPPAAAPVAQSRMEAFGRAALRTITAVDAGPDAPVAPSTDDVLTRRKVLPGGAFRLLAAVLLLAPLVTAVDGLARVRRRREPLLPWLRWTLICALPFALATLFVLGLGAAGLLTAVPDAPADPEVLPAEAAALVAAALVFVLGWVVLRPWVLRMAGAARDPAAPGAMAVLMIVAILACVVVWVRNPYAALVLAPALHVWLFALAPEFRRRAPIGIVAVLLGLAPLAAVAAVLAAALGLGPFDAAWVTLLALAGGHISLPAAALWCVLGGCAAGALLIASRGSLEAGDEGREITVRGPRGYAGPGSLGGTESALRQ